MPQTDEFRVELLATIPNLRAFAMSLCGNVDRADDLVQEALVKAWNKRDSFEMGTNLKAWMFTILRNEFYSTMRKRGREVSDSDGLYTARLAGHPEQDGKLDYQDFRIAMAKLPEDQREAIVLVGASGFSYEEAATVCGCAVGTVKSRVSRARAKLAELLDVDGSSAYGPDGVSAQVVNKPIASSLA